MKLANFQRGVGLLLKGYKKELQGLHPVDAAQILNDCVAKSQKLFEQYGRAIQEDSLPALARLVFDGEHRCFLRSVPRRKRQIQNFLHECGPAVNHWQLVDADCLHEVLKKLHHTDPAASMVVDSLYKGQSASTICKLLGLTTKHLQVHLSTFQELLFAEVSYLSDVERTAVPILQGASDGPEPTPNRQRQRIRSQKLNRLASELILMVRNRPIVQVDRMNEGVAACREEDREYLYQEIGELKEAVTAQFPDITTVVAALNHIYNVAPHLLLLITEESDQNSIGC